MSKLYSWWQKIRKLRVVIVAVAIVLVVVIALIILGYQYDWTGFNAYSVIWLPKATKGTSLPITRLEEQQPAKTLWDWLQLLIAPAAISLAVTWFTHVQQQRDRRLEQLQHDHEQQLADQRAKSEREAAEQRAQTEREIAADNQREASLQAYLNEMIELLLEARLQSRFLERPGDAEWEVARVTRLRTLILLRGLDAKRKRTVLQFLAESELLGPWGILEDADLSGVDLSKLKLRNVNLSKTNLSGANLSGADLLMADLSGADLIGAKAPTEQLNQAKSLQGATMPDGSIHP